MMACRNQESTSTENWTDARRTAASAHLPGNDGLIGKLKTRLAERMLEADMDVRFDDPKQQDADNHRYRCSSKPSPWTTTGPPDLPPATRHGQFDPTLIPKYPASRAAHILEIYGIEVWPNLVAVVTESVITDAIGWQINRWRRSMPSSVSTSCRQRFATRGSSAARRPVSPPGSLATTPRRFWPAD